MQKPYREDSFAVMAAIYSPTYLLLIQNLLQEPLWWKFIGESSEVGEYPLDTLVRGVWEEGGLMMRTVRDELGTIVELGDEDLVVSRVREPMIIKRRNHFEQHFYEIFISSDQRLLDLSGKRFDGDKDEYFETRAFPITDVLHMGDFFPLHVELFYQLKLPSS